MKKVCIIDDSPDILQLLQVLLNRKGLEVIAFCDGQEAIEGLSKLDRDDLPRVIFVDYIMPNMTGLQFREEQLKTLQLKEIPTFLLTAYSTDDNRFDVSSFTGYLIKPVRIDKLMEVVNELTNPFSTSSSNESTLNL